MSRPPRLAQRILLRRLHPDEHDEVIGDLDEQFLAEAAARGGRRARRWYWRQVFALVTAFSARRRDLISTEHQRVRGLWAAGNLGLDARYAWRGLRHSPSFTGVVVAMLALGIGLSTAVFSLVDGILLEPLPYPNAHRLVRISETSGVGMVRAVTGAVSDVGLGGWLNTPTAVAHLSGYTSNESVVGLPEGAVKTVVGDVGAQFFSVLSVTPVAGRVLLPSDLDRAAPPAAMISERLASRAFGGAQAALGKPVALETRTHTIVGVLPAAFAFPEPDVDIWRPGLQYARLPAPGARRNMSMSTNVIGLLADGTSLADAQAGAATVSRVLAAADPDFVEGLADARTFKVTRFLDDMVAPIRPALLVLGAGMAVTLLAICVTLANLMLGRNTARQRELAVRVALGASRWRVARPILVEIGLLTLAGGLAGTALAWWLLGGLPAVAPSDVPRIETIHFSGRTALFALVASAMTLAAVGWLPFLQMRVVNVGELTATGARLRLGRYRASGDHLRGLLVVGQVALAVVLLVGALLIGRSFSTLLRVDLGYTPDGVLTLQPSHPFSASREPGRLRGYYTEMLARIQGLPGVTAAGSAAVLPLHQIRIKSTVSIVGRPPDPRPTVENMAVNQRISAGYLEAIGTRIVRGRGITPADREGTERVVLVDETLARRFFPAGDAIGHQIAWGRYTWTIVGVVEAMRIGPLGQEPAPIMYFAAEQSPEFTAYSQAGIAVRATGEPSALIPAIRQIAREIDSRVPLDRVQPLRDLIRGNVAQPRFFTLVLGVFAALALSTALLGIYGVLAYAVERRRLELGIRRALGATERDIVTLVVRRGLLLAAVGVGVGLGGAAWGARFMRAMLYGITPGDPLSYAGAAAFALVIALLASWRPVRHALAVDPARALRVE